MLEKCVLTILELNWIQRLRHKKTKLNICHHMLTSSTQLKNRSFHVVERTITSSKCQNIKNARAKRAKILFFIGKYANLWGFCCRRRRGCFSSLIKLWAKRLALYRINGRQTELWTSLGKFRCHCFWLCWLIFKKNKNFKWNRIYRVESLRVSGRLPAIWIGC